MSEVTLYILMRADLASMNPGKKCAQAAHAAAFCVGTLPHDDPRLRAWRGEWGFGTCVVLHAHEVEMRSLVTACAACAYTGIVHDPEYPLVDGLVTHRIPLVTCAFVFGEKDRVYPYLRHLPLMP